MDIMYISNPEPRTIQIYQHEPVSKRNQNDAADRHIYDSVVKLVHPSMFIEMYSDHNELVE